MQEAESGPGAVRSRPLAVRGGLAVVLSVEANLAVLFAADALAVAPGFEPLQVGSVAFLSAAGAVGAVAVYALLRRYADRPDRTFVRVAAVVLVVSFLPDVALPSLDPAATVLGVLVLMFMHVVVAAVCVGLLVSGDGRG